MELASTFGADSIKNILSSNRGPLLEVLAPGVSIWSTKAGETYGGLSGTSQATPHVSGAVALIEQFAQESGLELTPDDVKNTLMSTGVPITGYPRIDVMAALESLGLEIPINQTNQSNNQSNETNETNSPPVVNISNPNNSVVTSPVSLQGSATDAEDGIIPPESLTWREGETALASGSNATHNFTIGEHNVTLMAIDSENATGEASVLFSVPNCISDLDQNNDSLLNIADIIVLLNSIFGDSSDCMSMQSEGQCLIDLDQNGDSFINIGDLILILTGLVQEDISDVFGEACFGTS